MDIRYTKTLSGLDKFPAWSGGKNWLDTFRNHPDAFNYLESFIEDWTDSREVCGEEPLTDTDINDFLWFDAFDMLVEAGYVDHDMNWKDD